MPMSGGGSATRSKEPKRARSGSAGVSRLKINKKGTLSVRPRIEIATEEICAKARRLSLLGCTHTTIAVHLGISDTTFYKWLSKSAKFAEAVKAGSIEADADVASALYRSATGNRRTVERSIVLKDGKDRECVETVQETIEDAPNVTAQIFWLKNRQRQLWRDMKATELSGPDGGPISNEFIPAKQLDHDERAKLRAFLEAQPVVADVVAHAPMPDEGEDDGETNDSGPQTD